VGRAILRRFIVDKIKIKELIKKAIDAKEYAYVPYSNFRVGAALLTKDGQIITGCNIENASFSPTNCAERTAIFKAVSEGKKDFEAIAICGGDKSNKGEYCPPCGVCRQVMLEFCDNNFKVILANNEEDYIVYDLEELTPCSFKKSNL
jgi:cytidine deaminase